ncbi:hypothetical protein MUK42_06273 [Musa troglodytarum]|uniref:Uncharacterized protein n=1 Tax=Musa troglodytarum TaxID=320322 RepID=A0A9E7HHM1_9LILI|nr:hypothetical protein MUK42_06273 [Musa troglodytarum]
MGACATKPMAQGDAPLPLEQPPSPRGSEVEDARKEEMVAAAGKDTKQGTPDKNGQKSLGDLFENEGIAEPTETDKHVVSETAAPETVEVKEEVIEHNEMDEAVEDGTEEQLVEIFESEPEEAIANVTPLKTSGPSLPTNSEESVGDVEPADSEVKASDQIANVESVESIPKEGPAAEEKKGDVFSALFNAYNNLVNKT